jgi:hypothetical protein
MVKFRETKNLMNVLTQYEILGFCRLGVNRLKFYRTKTWAIMTEFQPPISMADRNKTQEPVRFSGGFLAEKVGEIKE